MGYTDESLTLLASVPAGVCIAGSDDVIKWCNTAFCELLDVPADKVASMSIDELPVSRAASSTEDKSVVSPKGRPGASLLFSSTLTGAGDRLVMLTDVSTASRPSQGLDLNELAGTDLDTGLLSTKHIFKQLMAEVSRCRRYGNDLSLVLLKLKGGPLSAGDLQAVMSTAGVRIADNLRWVDFAGRVEDNGILLVLPETNLAAAVALRSKMMGLLSDVSVTLESGTQQSPAFDHSEVQWGEADDAMGLMERVEKQLVA